MESKFIALDKVAEEAEWLNNFLEDILVRPKSIATICIHCDNMMTQVRDKTKVYNGKSRYIRHKHNTIGQLLTIATISIDYVKSKENLVDPLTNGLPRDQFKFFMEGMRLMPIKWIDLGENLT